MQNKLQQHDTHSLKSQAKMQLLLMLSAMICPLEAVTEWLGAFHYRMQSAALGHTAVNTQGLLLPMQFAMNCLKGC